MPTPHLLNNSDPVRVGAGGDSTGLPFLSESFNEFFPQKCSKFNKKSSATKIRPNLYDKISDEIIVKIFSYLNRQSLGRSASVCQRYCFLFFLYIINVLGWGTFDDYSHLSNKRTGWNKRVLRAEFFVNTWKKGFYYIEINKQGGQKLENQ